MLFPCRPLTLTLPRCPTASRFKRTWRSSDAIHRCVVCLFTRTCCDRQLAPAPPPPHSQPTLPKQCPKHSFSLSVLKSVTSSCLTSRIAQVNRLAPWGSRYSVLRSCGRPGTLRKTATPKLHFFSFRQSVTYVCIRKWQNTFPHLPTLRGTERRMPFPISSRKCAA